MILLASRAYAVIDYQTLAEFIGHERLFRMPNRQFLLHMASERNPEADERVIWLNLRDAMTWLNESPEQYGSFWDEDEIGTARSISARRPAIGTTRL
jgi:hypothetical protein